MYTFRIYDIDTRKVIEEGTLSQDEMTTAEVTAFIQGVPYDEPDARAIGATRLKRYRLELEAESIGESTDLGEEVRDLNGMVIHQVE